LAELQLERAREFREEQKAEKRRAMEEEKNAEKERIKAAQQRSYAYVVTVLRVPFSLELTAFTPTKS
jgi:hypothetical protein